MLNFPIIEYDNQHALIRKRQEINLLKTARVALGLVARLARLVMSARKPGVMHPLINALIPINGSLDLTPGIQKHYQSLTIDRRNSDTPDQLALGPLMMRRLR